MALQRQSTNPLSDFGALVRRQWWSIVLPFAFVTALGVMIAQLMPRRYNVQTSVKIPESGIMGTGEIQRDVSSATRDMVAEPLVRSVIEAQEWPDYIGLGDKEKLDFVRRVAANIVPMVRTAGKNAAGSSYIVVQYHDSEGSRAEKFLNSLRDRYIESVVEGVRREAKSRRDTLKDLRKDYQDAYIEAEKVKSELVKSKNLAVATQVPGSGQTRAEDPIYGRLIQSQTQLATADMALRSEEAKLVTIQNFFDAESETIPESAAAAIANAAAKPALADDTDNQVRDLEMSILDMREKLKDYRPAAKAYQRIEDDIFKAESRIALLRGESDPELTKADPTRFVPNPKRALYETQMRDAETEIEGLKVQISSLKITIEDLSSEYALRQDWYLQLSYLTQDVQRAEAAYLAADSNYAAQSNRVALLEGPHANPFDVVEVATASDVPNAPVVPIVVLVSAIAGLALGLGWALTSEFLRNGFRSVPDLTRGLAVPVLGSVNLITTRAQARRRLSRHIMIAVSSAVIVGSILWVTWAYQNDSLRLLGPRLTEMIDDLRKAFRP